MEHAHFLLLNIAVMAVLLFVDRKRMREYVFLFAVGLISAFMFENFTTWLGFWYYHSEPMIPFVSLYTWLLYIPFLGYCYFVSNRIAGGGKK